MARRRSCAISNHQATVRDPILRDAAKTPLLPSERKCAHPGMRAVNSQRSRLELPLRPRGRARRRHHLRHRRHGIVDHADAGAGLSIRAAAGGADHGGRRRDGQSVAHPGLVARGRLARLRRLFRDRHSGRGAGRAHAADAAAARGGYFDRAVPDRDGAGAALARPLPI